MMTWRLDYDWRQVRDDVAPCGCRDAGQTCWVENPHGKEPGHIECDCEAVWEDYEGDAWQNDVFEP